MGGREPAGEGEGEEGEEEEWRGGGRRHEGSEQVQVVKVRAAPEIPGQETELTNSKSHENNFAKIPEQMGPRIEPLR